MHDTPAAPAPSPPSLAPPPSLVARTARTAAPDEGAPLRRISIELARVCNLRCIYCYSGASPERTNGLTDEEVRAVIAEAVEAGARMISIVGGGEPLLRRSILTDGESCIDYANALGCYCALYTNCTLVDSKAARWLHARELTVVGKLNSLRESTQDWLTGVPGSARRIRRGIDALLDAGFGGYDHPRFALETVICRANYDEMPEMWRWMRRRGIVPEVEIPTMHGRAADNRDRLCFDEHEAPLRYRELFEELLAVDRSEFGFDWSPHPPFAAGSCRLYETNCYINDRGGVQPCAGVDQEVGFLKVGPRAGRGQRLRDVLATPAFQAIRRVREQLQGACKTCAINSECYGCRAAAWHATGDLFAEDPICWRAHPGHSHVGSHLRRLPLLGDPAAATALDLGEGDR